MAFGEWLGNKLFGIDKVVERRMQKVLNVHNSRPTSGLERYRELEYKAWASSNPNNLLEFYTRTNEPTMYANRFLFWQWVGTAGINVPKMHYPAPETLINNMKSLLFGSAIDVSFSTDNDDERSGVDELNERLEGLLDDVEFYELLQDGVAKETYSGTIAAKFIIDADVHDRPIVEFYPKERIELITKYNKVVEIVFKDYYKVKDKNYTLRSHYGRGYIGYTLWNDKNKEVPLSTVDELKDLERVEFDKKIMMAVYKKNRTSSNEFADTPYGGSDFEGVVDVFHAIDEAYSSMMLYIRRGRPIMSVVESLLPSTRDGSRKITPKEFEFDFVSLKDKDTANIDGKVNRDIPELKTGVYMDTIESLEKTIYKKVGVAYTSVGLESHSANISGQALIQKEKPTQTVYNNKVKLWIPFIRDFSKLLLIYDDLMVNKGNRIVDDYEGYNLDVMFPDYNSQTFADKIKELREAVEANLIDLETAQYRLLSEEYNEKELKEILANSKLEGGVPLFDRNIDETEDDE